MPRDMTNKQMLGYAGATVMTIIGVLLLIFAPYHSGPPSPSGPEAGGTPTTTQQPPTSGQQPPPTSSTAAPPPPTQNPPAGPEKTEKVRLTGYSWQDNTPPGSSIISMPCIHKGPDGKGVAGGVGTFDDPITAAVPGHATSGVETPACTKFYVPDLKSYFIVEDSGATKVNGIRHFDLYVGGEGLSKSDSDACMSSYTGAHTAIFNPTDQHDVVKGAMTVKGGCKK